MQKRKLLSLFTSIVMTISMLSIVPASEAMAATTPSVPKITSYSSTDSTIRVHFVDRTDITGFKLELYSNSSYSTVSRSTQATTAQAKLNGLGFSSLSSNTLYYLKAYTYNGSGTSQPLNLAIRTKATGYPNFVASPTMAEQKTKALVDRNLQNSLNLLGNFGTFRDDTFGYSKLTGPSSTNGTVSGSGFTVNAGGENASDRDSKSYDNNIKFYMSAPYLEDSFTYTVSRSGKNYTFNQANNWGWGNPETGTGGIRYIPSSKHDSYYGNYTFNAWEVDTKTLSGLHRTSYTNDGKSYSLLTYNDLTSATSPLIDRDAQHTGITGNLWINADKIGLTYAYLSDTSNNSKPTTGVAGFKEGNYLNWALRRIKYYHDNQPNDTKIKYGEIPLDPQAILNDENWKQVPYDRADTLSPTLYEIAEEAIKNERQSGWAIALNDADKGTLSCTYDKVGNFKGKSVSVKLTVVDWQASDDWRHNAFRQYKDTDNFKTGDWFLTAISETAVGNWNTRKTPGTNVSQASNGSFATGSPYGGGNEKETCPLISFASDGIGINVSFLDWIKVDYTFFDEDGNEITDPDFKGRGTWKDIDYSQSVSFLPAAQNNGKGFTGIYDYDGYVWWSGPTSASKANQAYNINITKDTKYDSLLYKSWDYINVDGSTDRYWGVFDWVGTEGEDDDKTNWVYGEFNGPFSIIYGAGGHGDMAYAGVKGEYNKDTIQTVYQNTGDARTSNKRLATSPVTSPASLNSGSREIEVPSIQVMRSQPDAHNIADLTGTSYYGEVNITKYLEQKNGNYVKASGADWSDKNNVFFAIRDGNGKYLAFDLDASDTVNDKYVIDPTITYDNYDGSRQSKRVTHFSLNSSGELHITNIPAGTYFIEEILSGTTVRPQYSGESTIKYSIITGQTPSNPVVSEDGMFEVFDKESQNKSTQLLIYNDLAETGTVTFTKKAKTSNNPAQLSIDNNVANDLEFVLLLDGETVDSPNADYFVTVNQISSGKYSFDKLSWPLQYSSAPPSNAILKLDSYNQLVINDLPVGDYYLREITGNDIYFDGTMDDVHFTVTANSKIAVTGLNILKTGNITINKSFEGSSTPINGAKFSLTGTSDAGTPVNMTATVMYGTTRFSNVPYGTYTLSETFVPTGYDAVADRKVTVSSANSDVTVNLTDPLTKGFLKIIKENEDGSIPSGIAFNIKSVYTASGIAVDQTVVITNGTGYANLPVGRYIVTEIANSVPEDYLVADPQTVDVRNTDTFGSPVTVKFVNKLAEGPITITKKLTESYYTQEEFVFEVSETDKDGTVNKFFAYIVIPAGKTSGSVTIDKCRNGRTYSVRELNTNWRYTPVNDGTYLQVNGKSPTAEQNYSKNTATNTLSFKAVALNSNDYECIFTNKGHDHWLDDGATVTNVMNPIK